MPLELQAHLLRVLDAGGEYQRLGEASVRRSNFRLIAATNRAPGELRYDLLARFAVQLVLPGLSARLEDIPLLVRHFALRAAEQSPALAARFLRSDAEGRTFARVDTRLVEALLRRQYVANTRELAGLIWTAIARSSGDVIAYDDALQPACAVDPCSKDGARTLRTANPEPSADDMEEALRQTAGNIERAAKRLGLSSRFAFYRRAAKLKLDLRKRS